MMTTTAPTTQPTGVLTNLATPSGIVLDRVSKTYTGNGHRKTILRDVSFVFPEGRNVAIMGRNGAGKSTLMRLLSGAERPDKGHITRHGPVSWPMGFSGGFNGSMTGVENVLFVARLYGQDADAVLDYVTWFSELGANLQRPIKTYSSGMKARLAFGLSMAIPFSTYLIDEITAVGDEAFKRKCRAVFTERQATARVIMISHSATTIRRHCDCGVLLEDGQLTYHEDVGELIDRYRAMLEA
jgi:capsular polysaccharide transport system ATP-binding protein